VSIAAKRPIDAGINLFAGEPAIVLDRISVWCKPLEVRIMKKMIAMLMVLCVMGAFFAGCGSKAEESTEKPNAEKPAEK
jgi:hypothetical protein